MLQAPTHRDRDAAITLREANSSRAVSLPVMAHPPPAHSMLYVLWQVEETGDAAEKDKLEQI